MTSLPTNVNVDFASRVRQHPPVKSALVENKTIKYSKTDEYRILKELDASIYSDWLANDTELRKGNCFRVEIVHNYNHKVLAVAYGDVESEVMNEALETARKDASIAEAVLTDEQKLKNQVNDQAKELAEIKALLQKQAAPVEEAKPEIAVETPPDAKPLEIPEPTITPAILSDPPPKAVPLKEYPTKKTKASKATSKK